jgi:hypothetical protein
MENAYYLLFLLVTDNKYLFLPTPFYAELDEWMK